VDACVRAGLPVAFEDVAGITRVGDELLGHRRAWHQDTHEGDDTRNQKRAAGRLTYMAPFGHTLHSNGRIACPGDGTYPGVEGVECRGCSIARLMNTPSNGADFSQTPRLP
jgi:hypothetical protein